MKALSASKFSFKNVNWSNFNFFLLSIFFIVVAFGIIHHEMWRDELEAWLIARDSVSVNELLNNLEYTGHPALWYLCLYLLSKITSNPLIMQSFHLIVATGVIFIFIHYSPFNKLQKVLFCFGYFPLYEYGVISRSYALGVLLIFSFCALFCRKTHNYIYLAAILALLSNTSVYGLIISFVFAVMLAFTIIKETYSVKKTILRQQNLAIKLAISATIYLLSLSASTIQIIPPLDSKSEININLLKNESNIDLAQTSSELSESMRLVLGRTFTSIWRSYVPIPDFSIDSSWGTNILIDNHQLPEIFSINLGFFIAAFLSIVLFSIFAFIFVNNYKILFLYVVGTFSIMLFGLAVKSPAIRHNGHLFILLISCFWIHIYEPRGKYHNLSQNHVTKLIHKYQNFFLTLILCVQLYAGTRMYAVDSIKLFSNSQNAAQFIKDNQLEKLTIVGSDYKIVSSISAWLNRKIYYPEIRDFGTFTVWTSENVMLNTQITQLDILKQIEQLKVGDSDSLLLILDNRLRETSTSLDIDFLVSYEDSIVKQEKYFIYYVN